MNKASILFSCFIKFVLVLLFPIVSFIRYREYKHTHQTEAYEALHNGWRGIIALTFIVSAVMYLSNSAALLALSLGILLYVRGVVAAINLDFKFSGQTPI